MRLDRIPVLDADLVERPVADQSSLLERRPPSGPYEGRTLRSNRLRPSRFNAGRDAKRQIAHLLCEIVIRLRATGCRECEAFATGIRQAVVADITAVSLVHVNRVLHALQDADRIRLVKGVITIPDLDRVAAFADFDPGYLHLPDQVGPSQLGLGLLRGPSFRDGRNSVAL